MKGSPLKAHVLLVVNPGSQTTRLALFEGDALLAGASVPCSDTERALGLVEQAPARVNQARAFLKQAGRSVEQCGAIAARGGPLRPVPGGVYRVNDAMLADAVCDRFPEHVSKIACVVAAELARGTHVPAYVVDPVSTDEFDPVSRISGVKDLPRKSLVHALNSKAVARAYAAEIGRRYEDLRLITAHLGGGCSIAVHHGGRMVDSVDANGEGPFSPERSGGIRADDLARFVAGSGRPFEELRAMLARRSGLVAHLGTADAREVAARIERGDAQARLVFEAMAYGIAKHICGLAAAVCGRVDAVLLTGGLANSELLVQLVRERVSFLGPVRCYPGETEMTALRDGVLRVLRGEEPAKVYPTGADE